MPRLGIQVHILARGYIGMTMPRSIRLIFTTILILFFLLSIPFLSYYTFAQEPVIDKASVELRSTDPNVLKAIVDAGADPEYVELTKDYGLAIEGKHPYSRTYSDRKSNLNFFEVSQLPMVDAEGDKLNASWLLSGRKYYSISSDKTVNNLFWSEVYGTQVKLIVANDQPYGAKQGSQVIYNPQLFLRGKEISPSEAYASRYNNDPYNENYTYNVLEWDYGICKRQIRIVEGMYRETWLFTDNPEGEVKIVHNQQGNFPLSLGQYAINDDIEVIPKEEFIDPVSGYPLRINASATFFPDAHVENFSVDGRAWQTNAGGGTWAAIQGGAGNGSDDDIQDNIYAFIRSHATLDKWIYIIRGIILFDN